jgi:hypothetical protein
MLVPPDVCFDQATGKWLGGFQITLQGRHGIFHQLTMSGLIEASDAPRTPDEIAIALARAIFTHYGIPERDAP